MKLLHGDCLDLMKDIPEKSIDMILCDLPYGTTACKWDNVIPFEPLWEQYTRVIKDNGAIVLFSQLPFGAKLINSQPKLFRYEWIWNKVAAAGFLNAKKMPLRSHENILALARDSKARRFFFPKGRQGRFFMPTVGSTVSRT